MSTKTKMMVKKFQMVLAILVTTVVVAVPLQADAASNKALRMKVSFTGDKYTGDEAHDAAIYPKNGYSMGVSFQEAKPTKSMKMSADVYVPVSALKKDGDNVEINMYVNITEGETYIGDVNSKYNFELRKEGKKIVVKKYDPAKDKESSAGKLASVKKSGKYYVVKLKNIALNKTATQWNEDGTSTQIKIPTGNCWLNGNVEVIGTCSKSSGYVYADNLQLKAKKTIKITFDKKDYDKKGIWGWHNDKNLKVSVAAVK
ncbi:MAG: hypothetical protein IJ711_04635 [Lachnospiraceae bacterium]|nr:hypothetical protein [Lachnospiraceae bacterium]